MRSARARPGDRPGFTLLEMMIVLTLVTAMAALVLPSMGDNGVLRLSAGARVLTSDLEMAQVMTIADPSAPVVVKFDAPAATWWLAYAGTPDTPLPRPDTGDPYLVTMGQGRAVSADGVTFTISDISGDVLAYDSQGGLVDFTASPSVTVRLGSRWIRLDVSATTGTVTQTSGED